jgi:diaminopimelate epimerase
MEKIIFTKMSGAGNDFVVIDKQQNQTFSIDQKFVQKICERRNGVGADGLITIEDSSDCNFIIIIMLMVQPVACVQTVRDVQFGLLLNPED